MSMVPDTPELLIDQIAKCLRLAGVIGDSKTADILRAMAADYQIKLDQMQGRNKIKPPRLRSAAQSNDWSGRQRGVAKLGIAKQFALALKFQSTH